MRAYLILVLLPFLLATGSVRAAQVPSSDCDASAVGQQCTCEIEKLKPTQISVGWLHVQDILQDPPSRLQSRAEGKPTQVVIGPGGDLYVTDGHHHARAMLEQLRKGGGQATTRCQVIADYSNIGPPARDAFLTWLANRHQARLNGGDDVDGAIRPGVFPPANLAAMTDDSYRSLASFVEDGCGFKTTGDYGQFPLADLMRHARVHVPVDFQHKKQQGRRAAAELVASTTSGDLRSEFDHLANRSDLQGCATSPDAAR